jgi:hypothetical protein
MKSKLIKNVLIFSLLFVIANGCNQQPAKSNSDEKVTAKVAQADDIEKIKSSVSNLIQNSPKGINIINFLNEIGASFIYDLTLPVAAAEKFETQTDMSLALGVYGMDMLYAKTYNRQDAVVKSGEVMNQFIAKLGIRDELKAEGNNFEKLRLNEANKDSVDFYVNKIWNQFHAEIKAGKNPEIYALTFIGGNIEALYLLSQLTIYAKDNQAMIDVLAKQGELVNTMKKLLEVFSQNETVAPYVGKFKPLFDYYGEHKTFTQKELTEVAPIIEAVRNEIIN